ncbi:hypothetical protein AeMF1_017019 [Aphanomyces euteiches]|nr:hypothetical protein AeMF1_017019 [Aphanomyces euteiches]KAH9193490.1 hypothetical protein AeNC1_004522 [Aphanomyces euteiches]
MVFIMINGNMPPTLVIALIALQLLPLVPNRVDALDVPQDLLMIVLVVGYILYTAFTKREIIRERGISGFFSHLLDSLRGGVGTAANEPMNQENNELYSRMLKTISSLPTEEFKAHESCSIHEIKERLSRRGVPHEKCIEKEELVSLLNGFRGGPTASCCICYEDYAEGDVLRILSKCKHDFHLECLDKWALTLANSTRVPSCPLCNQEL